MLEYTSIKAAASDHAELASQLTSLVANGHTVVSIVGADGWLVAFLSRQVSAASTSSQPAPVAQPAPQPAPTPASNPVPSATPVQSVAPVQPAVQPVQPVVQAAPAQPAVPADWYKDPSGRYEYRYWDGSKWTTKVSRAGVMYDDPATP